MLEIQRKMQMQSLPERDNSSKTEKKTAQIYRDEGLTNVCQML